LAVQVPKFFTMVQGFCRCKRIRSPWTISVFAGIAPLGVWLAPAVAAEPPPTSSSEASTELADPRGFYASLGGGASWPQPLRFDDDRLGPRLPIVGHVQADQGFSLDLGLGYDFGPLRSELSFVRRQASIRSSNWTVGPFPVEARLSDPQVGSNSVFASLYADLPVNSRLVPYVGGGLGITALNGNATTLRRGNLSQTIGGNGGGGGVLGYEAKAGLAYRSSPRSDLFAEAVYQGAASRSQGSLDRSAINTWGFRLGLRYRFGRVHAAAAPQATMP